jgi:hypothetical protein
MSENYSLRNLSPTMLQFICCIGMAFLISANGAEPSSKPSKVVRATDPSSVKLWNPDSQRVSKLLNAAMLQYTDTKDIASAWQKFVKPTDRVGIKIYTAPGPVMSTRKAVIETVLDGLESAGVTREHMVIFDRYSIQMEAAGFTLGKRKDGVMVTATVPNHGFDSEQGISFSEPGKLIWGDLEFKENVPDSEDQLSSKSYFSKILTREVDKIINIGVLMEDQGLGVYGCQLNSSLSLIDNSRRLQRPHFSRDESLAELFAHPMIQKKCVLHILDGLVGQFAAGPTFDPHYCWAHQTIYVSRDAVALDSLALQAIKEQRPKLEVPSLKDQASYLEAASVAELGICDLSKIEIQEIKASP